jgi:hypothetical protein
MLFWGVIFFVSLALLLAFAIFFGAFRVHGLEFYALIGVLLSWITVSQIGRLKRRKNALLRKKREHDVAKAEEFRKEKFQKELSSLYLKVKQKVEENEYSLCRINLSGCVRWRITDRIQMRDRLSNISLNQEAYAAQVEHTSPFQILGCFHLKSDDQLKKLLENLLQLRDEQTCEMIDILESNSTLNGSFISDFSDAYDFEGVHWFGLEDELLMEQYAYDHGAKTCRILEGPFAGEVIEDTDGNWEVVERGNSYDGFKDLYDGIDLDADSAIVFYKADVASEFKFPPEEAGYAIRFLLEAGDPASIRTNEPS